VEINPSAGGGAPAFRGRSEGCVAGVPYEMRIASLDQIPKKDDAQIRIYKCASCAHEMRLIVWASDPPA
jgi:hypothetical protein